MNQRTIGIAVGVLLLVVGISFFIIYESKPEERIGGPCSYDMKEYPALIANIDTLGDDDYILYLHVQSPSFIDTVDFRLDDYEYGKLTRQKRSILVEGNKLVYERHEIISGACNPSYFTVRLKLFKEGQK